MTQNEEYIINVKGLAKKYSRKSASSIRYGLGDILNTFFNRPVVSELRRDEFWSLKHINFSLKRGECLGIVGSNGAGKSTLLKLLSGIVLPDKGEIVSNGKICSLLEVGSGFHPHLTARENIYIKGGILGLSRREITEKFESIVTFAGIEDSLEMPLKSFSSGMYARLGFSIAAHVDSDLLILDEVLAVGDKDFRMKCLNYINSIRDHTAIIFVSHNMTQVSRICTRGLYIQHGEIKASGGIHDVIGAYQKQNKQLLEAETNYTSHIKSMITSCSNVINQHDDVTIDIDIVFNSFIDFHLELSITDQNGTSCFAEMSPKYSVEQNKMHCHFHIHDLLLSSGTYFININILDELKLIRLGSVVNAHTLTVLGDYQVSSVYKQPSAWQLGDGLSE